MNVEKLNIANYINYLIFSNNTLPLIVRIR